MLVMRMTIKYKEYGKQSVFRDKSKNGLFVNFLKDYAKHFKINPTAGCNKCLNKYWLNYLNLFVMENKVQCDYELRKKYNGIQIGVNGNPIRNGEMTNEIAKELLEKHPRGADLFSKMPEPKEKKETTEEDNINDLSLKELRQLYPNIKSNSKAKFLDLVNENK